jgi:hypothetical protein
LIQRKFVFHAINNAHNEAITSQTGTAKAHRIAPAKVKNETTPDNTNQSVHRIARSERRTPETINNDSVNCGFLQIQLFSHSRIGVKACAMLSSQIINLFFKIQACALNVLFCFLNAVVKSSAPFLVSSSAFLNASCLLHASERTAFNHSTLQNSSANTS